MTGVTAMINKGLAKVKESMIAFIKKLCLNIDTNALEKAEITPIINWSIIQLALAPAAEFTAHARYQAWFHSVFRGTKRAHPDDEYRDEEHFTTSTSVTTPPTNSEVSLMVTPELPVHRRHPSSLRSYIMGRFSMCQYSLTHQILLPAFYILIIPMQHSDDNRIVFTRYMRLS